MKHPIDIFTKPDPVDDELIFEEDVARDPARFGGGEAWKILIVDDDDQVHEVTKLALQRLVFQDKPVTFLSAYTAAAAKSLLGSQPDIAVVLLDVVMEAKDSGLQIAKYIRETLDNQLIRIVLRTGQPGEAPEEAIILNFAINDYKTKAELTRQKLFTTVVTALRSYSGLLTIKNLYEELQQSYEALYLAKEQAERASRAKTDFLRIINHELRTPLNVIIGLAGVLAEGVYGPLNERQQQSILDLEQSGQHLAALINDILEFTNLQTESFALKMVPCDGADVCQQSARIIKQLADQKAIEIVLDLASPGPVKADPLRLQQILVNLLDNAVKFTPNQGKIGLGVSDQGPAAVKFTVWDTGIGISPQDIPRIFEPFFRVKNSLTEFTEGAGLGLSLVRRLVNLHGGEITVNSEPGQGTTFTIVIKR